MDIAPDAEQLRERGGNPGDWRVQLAADLEDYLALGMRRPTSCPTAYCGAASNTKLLPKCVGRGIGVLCYSPLAQHC